MLLVLAGIVLAYILFRVVDHLYRKPQVEGQHNKAVFITGCDSGFGYALALRLDGLGCPVFAGCYSESGATQLKAAASERLCTVIVDVSNSESIQTAYDYVCNNIPSNAVLWGVVNNAGVAGIMGPAQFITRQDYINTFQVNTFGVADVTATFLPLLKKSKGRLVLCASAAGRVPFAINPTYTASKFAVEALGGCFRQELKQWGIHVCILEPGMYKTNIADTQGIRDSREKQWRRFPDQLYEQYGKNYLEKSCEVFIKVASSGPSNFDDVTEAYTHALFAVNPRAHYSIGLGGRRAALFSLLPAWFTDAVYSRAIPNPTPAALQRDQQ